MEDWTQVQSFHIQPILRIGEFVVYSAKSYNRLKSEKVDGDFRGVVYNNSVMAGILDRSILVVTKEKICDAHHKGNNFIKSYVIFEER
ncbi:hypothetical protein ACJBYX_00990 [Streptococcus suis]|uniref:hypothetical protein n=1 Tax=Streptococcus suis TaxID=1307 RepID=UPI0011468F48|nr:hypothetical protein [Streptococcus suis]MCH1636770.1 hypothetical protein [Streptococcus suis]MCH1647595.1 hypothetical protein [Streptococcus suis]TQE45594.1 hypothetical protein FH690_05965 [Streptococcus suis]HEM3071221.1 hypothetical protein [Streptococcus suis]HEM3089295.1 hypothetical protein [Streptococcus suis]